MEYGATGLFGPSSRRGDGVLLEQDGDHAAQAVELTVL